MAAILLSGLPAHSRVNLHYSKQPVSTEILLLSSIADSLNFISWSKTKDAEKGKNRPSRIIDSIYGKDKKDDITTYDTPEDYKASREAILKQIRG